MPAKLMLFWDYDTQWGADRSRTGGGAKNWGHLEFPNTERLLDLHAQYDLKACFAIVGAAALDGERPYHDPAQIRQIQAAGHEIASHSFQHEWLPALGEVALRETLRQSKDALEQCIGAAVGAFVPPFDMPMDYPSKLAFNLTERRQARPERTDLPRLCAALHEVGYQFCRVSYRPLPRLLLERLSKGRFDRPSTPQKISGLTCLRVNNPPGFDAIPSAQLERFSQSDGYIILYGHPHHLSGTNRESEKYFLPILEQISRLRRERGLEIVTPRHIWNQAD